MQYQTQFIKNGIEGDDSNHNSKFQFLPFPILKHIPPPEFDICRQFHLRIGQEWIKLGGWPSLKKNNQPNKSANQTPIVSQIVGSIDESNTNQTQLQGDSHYKLKSFPDPNLIPPAHLLPIPVSLSTACRFMTAREFNVEEALAIWRIWIEWWVINHGWQIAFWSVNRKNSTQMQGLPITNPKTIPPSCNQLQPPLQFVPHRSEPGHYQIQGMDANRCTIGVIRMRKFRRTPNGQYIDFLHFVCEMEQCFQRSVIYGSHKMSIIFDKTDAQDSYPSEFRSYAPLLTTLFPEVLQRVVMVGLGLLFRALWQITKLFLAKRTKMKFILIANRECLQEYFAKDELTEEFGGTKVLK